MIVADKLDYYSLLLLTTKITKTTVFFHVKPKNIFARWLASPIKLKYDRKTKKLLQYSGVSHVPKNINRKYRVITKLNYNQDDPLFLLLYKKIYQKKTNT